MASKTVLGPNDILMNKNIKDYFPQTSGLRPTNVFPVVQFLHMTILLIYFTKRRWIQYPSLPPRMHQPPTLALHLSVCLRN